VGKGGTGGDGDTAGTGSIEPGGSVRLSLFFDIWSRPSVRERTNDETMKQHVETARTIITFVLDATRDYT